MLRRCSPCPRQTPRPPATDQAGGRRGRRRALQAP
jgi:hypothetical protein